MILRTAMTVLALAAVQIDEGATPPADERIHSVRGYVAEVEEENEDFLRLEALDARLLIPEAERETYLDIIDAASASGLALRIRFDAIAGRLDSPRERISYPLCSISVDSGASFGDEARNCPASTPAQADSERLLALGLAQAQAKPETARRTLSEALTATPELTPRARVFALKARAGASESLSYNRDLSGPAYDARWAEALADYREIARLLPDRPSPQFAVAESLVELGGYDEALAIYREVGRRWPNEAFNVAVATGALYRQRGDYRRALRQLDDYARSHQGEELGMRFHYHRAWTLTLLGRDDDALREIDAGLAMQPDYASAYLLRACARTRLGRLPGAIEDLRQAIALLSHPTLEQSAGARTDRERARRNVERLEQAITTGEGPDAAGPCEGHWDRWIRPRSPSPLLSGRS